MRPSLLTRSPAALAPLRPTPTHPKSTPRRATLPPRAAAPDTSPSPSSTTSSPPSDAGRAIYAPPSFDVLVADAAVALGGALATGATRLEVEFPALPGDKDGYSGSSDQYIDNNIQFAVAAARRLIADERVPHVQRVRVLVPDPIEARRATARFEAALTASPGVTLGHLKESGVSGLDALAQLFGGGRRRDRAEALPPADAYIAVNLSTVELVDAEQYSDALEAQAEAAGVDKAKAPAFIFWNCELDTLRADLGLFGFPPKDVQYRFLARFLPAFYIRPRDYAASIATPPYIVSYSGALFREYPGPWQVMVKKGAGEYACVAEDRLRYTLGEAKLEMAAAVGLGEAVGGDNAGARAARGVRTSTWWEDDFDLEGSHDWRK